MTDPGQIRPALPKQRRPLLLRSACADYDMITIRTEVNGPVEPLTDPRIRLHI